MIGLKASLSVFFLLQVLSIAKSLPGVGLVRHGGLSGGFAANFEKNFRVNVPEAKYQTQYVKVETPIDHYTENKVIDTPNSGFTGEFVASFEKNFKEDTPDKKYSASLRKKVDVRTPDVKYGTQPVNVDTPIAFVVEEKAVEIPPEINSDFSAGIAATIEKKLDVNTPKVTYETQQEKLLTPAVFKEEENADELEYAIVKGGNADFAASGSFGINVDVPHTKVDVVVQKAPQSYEENTHHKEVAVEVTEVDVPKEIDTSYVDVRKGIASSGPATQSHALFNAQGQINFAPAPFDILKELRSALVRVMTPLARIDVRKSIRGAMDIGVNAPFTDVAASNHGLRKSVRVRAPFTHVATGNGGGNKYVNVQAPFTSVHSVNAGLRKKVHVRAPFVDVKTGSEGVRVIAPFVDIFSGPKNIFGKGALRIKVPFLDLNFR